MDEFHFAIDGVSRASFDEWAGEDTSIEEDAPTRYVPGIASSVGKFAPLYHGLDNAVMASFWSSAPDVRRKRERFVLSICWPPW